MPQGPAGRIRVSVGVCLPGLAFVFLSGVWRGCVWEDFEPICMVGGRGRTDEDQRAVPAVVGRKILKEGLEYLKVIFRLLFGVFMIYFFPSIFLQDLEKKPCYSIDILRPRRHWIRAKDPRAKETSLHSCKSHNPQPGKFISLMAREEQWYPALTLQAHIFSFPL